VIKPIEMESSQVHGVGQNAGGEINGADHTVEQPVRSGADEQTLVLSCPRPFVAGAHNDEILQGAFKKNIVPPVKGLDSA